MEHARPRLRLIQGGISEQPAQEPWYERAGQAIVGHEKELGFTREEFDELDKIVDDFEKFIEDMFGEEAPQVDELCIQFVAGVLTKSQFDNKMREIFPLVRDEKVWQAEVLGNRSEPAGGMAMIEDAAGVYENVLLGQFHTHAACVRRYNEMISKIRSFGLI